MKRSLLAFAAACAAVGAVAVGYERMRAAAPAASVAAPLPSTARVASTAASVPPLPSATSALPSPETTRLQARRQLYQAVDALLQASQLEQARQLLDDDVARNGDELAPEWHDVEQSYRLLADCLERPSARLRVRAEAFVGVSQASSLKPRILAACRAPR